MSTSAVSTTRFDSAPWVRAGAAGLVAGLVFAMWAMVVGLVSSNLWAPPQGIGQAIGIGHQGHDFQLFPFVIGLMGHMMNSIIFGVIFFAMVMALKLRGGIVLAAGMAYGFALYLLMYFVVLRGVLSGSSASFLSADPEWSWIVAHLMYGVALGALLGYGPLAARAEAR